MSGINSNSVNLKRNVIAEQNGLKAIYNFTDGTFIAEIHIYAVGPTGQQSIPAIVMDLAKALNPTIAKPTPEELAILSKV